MRPTSSGPSHVPPGDGSPTGGSVGPTTVGRVDPVGCVVVVDAGVVVDVDVEVDVDDVDVVVGGGWATVVDFFDPLVASLPARSMTTPTTVTSTVEPPLA